MLTEQTRQLTEQISRTATLPPTLLLGDSHELRSATRLDSPDKGGGDL